MPRLFGSKPMSKDLRRENGMLQEQLKHEREAKIREIELLDGMIPLSIPTAENFATEPASTPGILWHPSSSALQLLIACASTEWRPEPLEARSAKDPGALTSQADSKPPRRHARCRHDAEGSS
jgi:hypothetical protein